MSKGRDKGDVNWDGIEAMERSEDGEADTLRGAFEVTISNGGVRHNVRSFETGIDTPIESGSPDVIEHYRRVDHAKQNHRLLNRAPQPSPRREPIQADGGIPPGTRVCRTCDGRQTVLDDVGAEIICPNCGGDGYVLDGIGRAPGHGLP